MKTILKIARNKKKILEVHLGVSHFKTCIDTYHWCGDHRKNENTKKNLLGVKRKRTPMERLIETSLRKHQQKSREIKCILEHYSDNSMKHTY